MIKLKAPLNYRGTIIEKDSAIGYFSAEFEENLIKAGVAEKVVPNVTSEEKSTEKPLEKMAKAELLELAAKLGIQNISKEMTKAEILEAIVAAQQGENESSRKVDE